MARSKNIKKPKIKIQKSFLQGRKVDKTTIKIG
jgi:hypothetical protein